MREGPSGSSKKGGLAKTIRKILKGEERESEGYIRSVPCNGNFNGKDRLPGRGNDQIDIAENIPTRRSQKGRREEK